MSKNRVIVEAVVLLGRSQREVAAQYGVSQAWVSKLVGRWRREGWPGVEKQSTRPKTNPRTTPSEVVEAIIDLRQQLLQSGFDAGPQTISHYLTHRGMQPPSPATIWNILKRHNLITPQPKKRPKSSYIRFEADLPNECWQSDFTHYKLSNGRDTNILIFIDDHSRYIISMTAHRVVTGHIVHTEFCKAMEKHGKPASTLTDNGFVFTTKYRQGPNAFEIELLTHGIQQKNGRPNHPQTQGKVERLNQTLKHYLDTHPRPHTIDELQDRLNTFTEHYNHYRPHRSLGGKTPHHHYTARAKATPTHRDGHWRIREDKIYATGNVTLRRGGKLHHIGIGKEHARTPIRMLINDLHVIIVNKQTGEILRELTIDPTKNSQPRGLKPGPKKGSPARGGRPKKHPN